VAAGLNRPVTTGDKVWSDNDGQVELQLDGSLLRLSHNTGCSFLNLSDNATQVQLTAGTLLVRVRRLDENETYEIDTPNLAFSALRPGSYKIAVNENGDTTVVIARSGEGEVTGGGAAYTIHAHDSYVFSGTDQLYATREDRVDQDQFDAWADSRDRRWENSRSEHYVSDDVIGYQDLEEYGAWHQTPGYGYAWFPHTTEPDWAPYRYGHWDYIEPWGYTWVEDEPWGFAPFHYGRWVNYEGAWGWVPAPPRAESVAYVRPVYAPALVVWVGGVAGADVAWFALGPREVYVPSYPVSRNYVERVNVSNTTVNTTVVNNYYNTTVVNKNATVTNVNYVNRSVPGALVATNSQVLTTAQPVARNAMRVDPRAAASARVGPATPTVAPMKQAVLGAAPAKAQPPAKVETRTVVAKAAPPPPPPSFEKRQEAIKNNGGKPLSAAQMRQIEPAPARSQPLVKIAPAAKPAATPPPQPPSRASQPNTAPPAKTEPTAEPSNRPADRPPSANQPKPQPNQPPTPSNVQPKPAERPAERREPPNNPPPPQRNDRPATEPVHPDDKPPAARTAPPLTSNPNVNKKQQQEQEQMRAQQEQERQRLQQQQEQEHAKAAQQHADQAQKQRMEQQHQQQTQQQQQKHAQEQKQLEQKQQQERQGQEKSKKPEHPPAQQP
jgi:DNA segregation ATPase FtsK/SpoIIIE-like protein